MSTIRKISCLVILFFVLLIPAAAQTDAAPGHYSFSLAPLTGLIVGHAEEILYKYPDSDQYVSELLWDLKPLFYLGLEANFGPRLPFEKSGFTAAASLKFGLPFKTGIIEDRDWQDDYEDYLTNYSRHDAYLQNAILIDISAGYSWRIRNNLVLSTYAEFSFMYFSWMAENGYLQYSAKLSPGHYEKWDESIPKIEIYGPGIRYTQSWFIFAPALAAKWKPASFFSLAGNISYSPLIFCSDRDDHLVGLFNSSSKGTLFYADFKFGHYINGGASFTASIIKNTDIILSISGRYITGLRDESFFTNIGVDESGYKIKNAYDGGVGYIAIDVGLAARIRIHGR